MNRRDLIMGGGLLTAAGAAFALTPRKRLVLLGDRDIDSIVPNTLGDWKSVPSDAFVLPKSPGSLADRLYSQTLTRLYMSPTSAPVMLVIAYGAMQNDLLQLHRPEVCYAAVGFNIANSRARSVSLAGGATLPVRELEARSDLRTEAISYWTRIGDDLPLDGREQRAVKLRQQMAGYLSDGVLVRMSTIADPTPAVYAALARFGSQMLQAIKPADRDVLIGRPLARRMSA